MKAVLISPDQNAFIITDLHDSPEQHISATDMTKWRWSVTAQETGKKNLELIIYRLIKYDNTDYWPELESYRANIRVKVTLSQWLKSLDWKWIAGILVTALLIPIFFRWYDAQDNAKNTIHNPEKKVSRPDKPKRPEKKDKT